MTEVELIIPDADYDLIRQELCYKGYDRKRRLIFENRFSVSECLWVYVSAYAGWHVGGGGSIFYVVHLSGQKCDGHWSSTYTASTSSMSPARILTRRGDIMVSLVKGRRIDETEELQ